MHTRGVEAAGEFDEETVSRLLLNFLTFLEQMIVNIDTSRKFRDAHGTELLLKIYTLPRLPHHFAASLAANHLVTIFRTMVTTQGSALTAGAVRSSIRMHIDATKAAFDKGVRRRK